MIFTLLFLISSVYGQGKWIFYPYFGLPGALSYGRLDPIVTPGAVSGHVHTFHGGNSLTSTFDYDTARNDSTCSTVEVQDDLSNYWSPAMYHYDGSKYSLLLSTFHVYYAFVTYSYDANNKSGSSQRYPFPPGFKMIAGSVFSRATNKSDPRTTANSFGCVLANGTVVRSPDYRNFQRAGLKCSPLTAQLNFPSCWDGVTDNTDGSHVAYPGYGYVCPPTHPYAFLRISYEWYWPTQNFPMDSKRDDNWVLSYGDTSGYGFHGDFVNGWNMTLLQQAINLCNVTENGIENCAPFSPYTRQTIPSCMPTGLYPDEPVGLEGPLTSLPGCNPLWTDNSTKPTCDDEPEDPPITKELGPDLTNWEYISCPLGFQGKGLILSAYKRTDWNDMTVDSCLAACKNYKYAAMAWGNRCYCDNQIQQNASVVSDPNYVCQSRCAGNQLQFCGGLGSFSLYESCSGLLCKLKKLIPPLSIPALPVPSIVLPLPVSRTTNTPSGIAAESTTSVQAASAPTSTLAVSTTSTSTRSTKSSSSSSPTPSPSIPSTTAQSGFITVTVTATVAASACAR